MHVGRAFGGGWRGHPRHPVAVWVGMTDGSQSPQQTRSRFLEGRLVGEGPGLLDLQMVLRARVPVPTSLVYCCPCIREQEGGHGPALGRPRWHWLLLSWGRGPERPSGNQGEGSPEGSPPGSTSGSSGLARTRGQSHVSREQSPDATDVCILIFNRKYWRKLEENGQGCCSTYSWRMGGAGSAGLWQMQVMTHCVAVPHGCAGGALRPWWWFCS